ncbi:MAG: 2-hydroxychromene-2-carboxylate isomerase [Acidobacteria bacterium]|nr:MAG: 2-hydroxychromene-2-carboxylate isomerase [Acidobacteriota bacterium]REK09608.1 MAG: 2-hydroxychromene-2-carboxylate isomerase [Acidobacteriota bacterium]
MSDRTTKRERDRERAPDNAASPITFYFDYISHNAYVAWHALRPIADRHEREVEATPVLFAALLDAHGSVGPAEIPAKTRWMIRDVARKAIDLGLPLAPPASHPFRPLVPLRATAWFDDRGERDLAVTALFAATWAHGLDVSDPAVVRQVLDEAGLDGEAAVRWSEQPEGKLRLRQDTEAAIARGVFGVPTMIADDRLFWGYDDLINLERYLRGDDPLERTELPSWRHVRPTAQRRR